MTVHVRILLLVLTGLTGIHSITTVSDVSVKAGDSISIPCHYESQYRNHVKYLCEGYHWSSCSYAVKTNQPSSGRFSISDDKKQTIFTVTVKNVTDKNTDYWCAVEIDKGSDVKQYFHLSVTRGTPRLSVDHQEIRAFNGDNITINCYNRNAGEMMWCGMGRSCVTRLSGSLDGTSVTINATLNVFTVTMSGLRTESSGWYWCVKGALQMPVHVTVDEQPTTTTSCFTTLTPIPVSANLTLVFSDKVTPTVEGEHKSSSVDLKDLIIPLSLLISIVMVTLFIWLMLKRHKQTKAESSATTTAEREVTYSTVIIKRKTSSQRSDAKIDLDVMYSSVVAEETKLKPTLTG